MKEYDELFEFIPAQRPIVGDFVPPEYRRIEPAGLVALSLLELKEVWEAAIDNFDSPHLHPSFAEYLKDRGINVPIRLT